MSPDIVIVGGGLAGLAAAIEAATSSHSDVLLLEKEAALGGNSQKASSGINGITPASGDTTESYITDTLRSGQGLSDDRLVQRLVEDSQAGLEFLRALGQDLEKVVRLGGHSVPRTHANAAPGPNIGAALIKAAAARVASLPNVSVVCGAKVESLDRAPDGRVRVAYSTHTAPAAPVGATAAAAAPAPPAPDQRLPGQQQQQQRQQVCVAAHAVVLATGGFAASRELLRRHCPAAAELATTNGAWATGDGLALGAALGGELIQLEQVQVHPTGFVDPSDPGALVKWLAPEKLRGCGALLLDARGERFVDELATRDVVAAAVGAQPGGTAWLLLGAEGGVAFGEGVLGFYASRGMIKKAADVEAAAVHMGVAVAALRQTIASYEAAAAAGAPDPATSKRFYPSSVGGAAGPLWVARVTPVVHYCMGGLRVDDSARVLTHSAAPVAGLFAAGEVAGGLHGANRLGGNSLAECVVFGRIAGRQAAAQARQLPVGSGDGGAGSKAVPMAAAAAAAAAL